METQKSKEFERALLGSILIDPSALNKVIPIIKTEHFYYDNHAIVFQAILELNRTNQPVETISLTAYLIENHLLEKVGGAYYITGLRENIPTAVHASYYAQKIVEYYHNSELMKISQSISDGNLGKMSLLQNAINQRSCQFQGINTKSLTEMIKDGVVEPKQIIGKGLLPEKSILIIGGPPKSYKTMLSINLGLCIASGENWFEFPVEQKEKVLIIQAEVHSAYYSQRLFTMEGNAKFNVNSDNLFTCDRKSHNILDDKDFNQLQSLIRNVQPKVLIIDPLAKFHREDENSNDKMQLVMERLRQLTDMGLSIILVHHSRKFVERSSIDSLRGASVIAAEADAIIQLMPKSGKISLKITLRHGHAPDNFQLHLNANTLWLEQIRKSITDRANRIYEYVKDCGVVGRPKKQLAELIASEFGVVPKTAYREISKLIKDGILKQGAELRNSIVYINNGKSSW